MKKIFCLLLVFCFTSVANAVNEGRKYPSQYIDNYTYDEDLKATKVVVSSIAIISNVNASQSGNWTSAITSSSPTAKVTAYSGDTEILYSTSVIKDQNYGSGTQLAAGSTFYWTIFDGTQTEDYYLKNVLTVSESSGVFIVLYTGGNGATDLQLLNSGSAAFTNAIYIDQSSTYHKNLNFNLHNRKISAGTILRMLFNNTSTSAGDLIANMHYSVKQ